ncbi:hypothetical protein [Spartinivicinus ruber]|uniref:hypothetical protein n=1 Tax=Spartinivicinus ruber TaxID=2683272 RepID=UPI0013D530F3|nr:hypothetical protein [Spartinivicinus ruber]
MKLTLRIIGLIGACFFTLVLWLTFSIPGFVEDVGREFIKSKIKEETGYKIEEISVEHKDSKLFKLAQNIYDKNSDKIDEYKEKLRTKVHKKIAIVIAEMQNLDCECRKKHEKLIKESYQSRVFPLTNANEKLLEFMKTKYMEVSIKLKQDFRIFTVVNLLAFTLT